MHSSLGRHFSAGPLHLRQNRLDSEPITLATITTVNPNESTDVKIDSLRNPTNDIIAIHEFKWTVRGPSIGTSASVSVSEGGVATLLQNQLIDSTIEFGFSYNGEKLSATQVSAFEFPRSESLYTEQMNAINLSNFNDICQVTSGLWRLDSPVYLRPGEYIAPVVSHRGLTQTAVDVTLGFSGRIAKKMPEKRYLPFVARYLSKGLQTGPDATQDSSQEQDLVNSTDQILQVKRFTGRVTTYSFESIISTVEGNGPGTLAFGPAYDTEQAAIGGDFLTILLRDSRGYSIVRNPTPFRDVFPAPLRAWECDHLLPPGAYYIADLVEDDGGLLAEGFQIQVGIAMVGYRETRA